MSANFQFAGFCRMLRASALRHFCEILACAALVFCPALYARQAPPAAIGRITGNDVSVNGVPPLPSADAGIQVASGNVVTVHAGQAHLQLTAGGEIAICGPAKFTVLQSGDSITLALEFGRIHVELASAVALRVLTPTILATPLDIRGASRDLTMGLDQDNSLCVVAASGAVQLEQQFSGERMIIPESGDFSLAGGQLVPVALTGEACRCAVTPQVVPTAPSRLPPPETALVAPPVIATPRDAPLTVPSAPESAVEYSVPAHADETHPLPAPDKSAAALAPPDATPVYKVILPPLSYSSSSPLPPNDPSPESALLIREVHVNPNWDFEGRVEPPPFARELSRALGQGPPVPQVENPKKHGFWSSLKRIFS